VADSGLYSADNVARLSQAGARWITRVPDSSREARAALTEAEAAWQSPQQAAGVQWAPVRQTPLGERWVVVCATAGEERAHATLAHQVAQTRQVWEQRL
jgi:transposase